MFLCIVVLKGPVHAFVLEETNNNNNRVDNLINSLLPRAFLKIKLQHVDEKCYFKLSSLNYFFQISAAEFYKRRNSLVMTSSPKAKGDKPRKIYLLWVLINKYQNIW